MTEDNCHRDCIRPCQWRQILEGFVAACGARFHCRQNERDDRNYQQYGLGTPMSHGRLGSYVLGHCTCALRGTAIGRWCPRPDSNRHGPFGPRDFKSLVSTNSTTRAGAACLTWPRRYRQWQPYNGAAWVRTGNFAARPLRMNSMAIEAMM